MLPDKPLSRRGQPDGRARRPPAALARILGWTPTSYLLISAFLLTIFIIMIVWWPLVVDYVSTYSPHLPWWQQVDWLLLGIFFAMSLLIMARPDLRVDLPIVVVGFAGGLVIESWGTQTQLWTYFTQERPPLWIIPAWPVASLAIDRLYRLLHSLSFRRLAGTGAARFFVGAYWTIFPAFYLLMLPFIWPTLDQSLTRMALLLCLFLTLTTADKRAAVLTFIAGSALGYFLERWGTTRLCWTYYTLQTPPPFAVFAHGMAAVAFWRSAAVFPLVLKILKRLI